MTSSAGAPRWPPRRGCSWWKRNPVRRRPPRLAKHGVRGGPAARCASSLANAETISLATAAASAGHKKGVTRNKRHRRCNRRPQTVGLPERIVNAADRRHVPLFGKSVPPLIARWCCGHLYPCAMGRADLMLKLLPMDVLLIGAKLTSAYRLGTMKSLQNGALQCRWSEARSRVTTSIG